MVEAKTPKTMQKYQQLDNMPTKLVYCSRMLYKDDVASEVTLIRVTLAIVDGRLLPSTC